MSESIARRRFLTQTAGAVCGFSVINGLATPADAQVVQALMAAVSWLGRNVLAPVAVSAFTKWLNNSRLLRTPEDGSFHDHFNPGVAFDTPFQAQRTQWTGYLGVDRLPALSTAQNSPMEGELNLAEIRELQNDRNPQPLVRWAAPPGADSQHTAPSSKPTGSRDGKLRFEPVRTEPGRLPRRICQGVL